MIRQVWSRLTAPVRRHDWKWVGLGALLGLAALALLLYWPTRWIPDWAAKSETVVIAPGQKLPPGVKPGASPSPSPSPSIHVKGEDRIIAIWSKSGLGHACPVSPTDALTAEHIALDEILHQGSQAYKAPFVVWGDELGNNGTAQWQWSDKRRDLSLLRVVPGTRVFSAHLRRAPWSPAVGSKVYIVGYKFSEGLGDWTMEAKVTGVRAGVLVYETTPGPGSSGGCVLNERGEIVAVNVAMIAGEGLGLLVVGEWVEVPDEFLEGQR